MEQQQEQQQQQNQKQVPLHNLDEADTKNKSTTGGGGILSKKNKRFHNHARVESGWIGPYIFPFILREFINVVSKEYNKPSSKNDDPIVEWTEEGAAFFLNRNHPKLPQLLKQYFGHDKFDSLRRQLNIYGFKLNKNGNFERKGINPFHRDSTTEELQKIIPRPKRSRLQRLLNKQSTAAIADGSALALVYEELNVPSRARKTSDNKNQKNNYKNIHSKKKSKKNDSASKHLTSFKHFRENELKMITPSNIHHATTTSTAHSSSGDSSSITNTSSNASSSSSSSSSSSLSSTVESPPPVVIRSKKKPDATLANNMNRSGVFATLMYTFINEVSKKNSDAVRWSADGTKFVVNNESPYLERVFESYFKHQNYESLRRQLNAYGFRKGPDGYFRHPLFHRDKPENCEKINVSYRIKRKEINRKKRLNRKLLSNKLENDNDNKIISEGKTLTNHSKKDKIEPTAAQIAAITGDLSSTSDNYSESDESSGDKGSSHQDTQSDNNSDNSSDGEDSQSYRSEVSPYVLPEPEGIAATKNRQLEIAESDEVEDYDYSETESKQGNVDEPDDASPPPEPSFKIFQRVYVADNDGILFEAVIHEQLYGAQYVHQVLMELTKTPNEAEILRQKVQDDPTPMWHYLVHYSSWNVNFEAWVPEIFIYKKDEKVKELADQIFKEQKTVRHEIAKKMKGRAHFEILNSANFLRAWKSHLANLKEELKLHNKNHNFLNMALEHYCKVVSDKNVSDFRNKSGEEPRLEGKNIWTRIRGLMNNNDNEKGVTSGGNVVTDFVIPLPFTLKKKMVESWEVIRQRQKLTALPTPVTVRQALNMYLQSKNVYPSARESTLLGNVTTATAHVLTNKANSTLSSEKDDVESQRHDWIDMANGIAMLFDDAVGRHLLYREEIPQFQILEDVPYFRRKSYSEIYGCEHLLRLFVRLPNLLSNHFDDAETRAIAVKVSDFLQFLQKNQDVIFTHVFQKLTEKELMEQNKMMMLLRKRDNANMVTEDHLPVQKKARED